MMLNSVTMRTVMILLFIITLLPWTVQDTGSLQQRNNEVEIVALRTQNTKIFQRPDGSGYAQVFSYPVHYQDAAGAWADIRPELIQLAGGGGWANTADDISVQFQSRSVLHTRSQINASLTPLVSLSATDRSISFEPIGARAVQAVVRGSRITYKDIFDGVDLQYINAPDALKEDLTFRSRPSQAEFAFALRVSGVTPRLEDNGGVSLEPCGDPCWSILPPDMQDANGASSDAVKVRLDDLGNGSYVLTYAPDPAWLADSARVYPVVLDPTVDTRGSGDTLYTQQGAANTAGYKQRYLSLGYDPENVGKQITRAFFYAPMPTLPGGSTINGATLNMFQYYAPYTTGYNTVVYRTTADWKSNPVAYTWNNPPDVDGNAITTASISKDLGWKTWDITSLVQQWNNGIPNNGVAIYANPEGTRGAYFCSSHALGTNCSPSTDALQLRPYIVINYTTGIPGGPTNTPTPTITPTPYVPPSSPRLTINPNSVALNTNTTVTLEGVPAGHRVRLISNRGSGDIFGAAYGNADGLGRFSTTLRSGNAGTATVTAKNETTGKTFGVSAQISFKSPPPQPKPAVITGIRTTYPLDARYLQGIPLNNTIEATIDWKGSSVRRAVIIVNGRSFPMSVSANTASAIINMGSDLSNGRNTIRVAIYNGTNQFTDYKDFTSLSVAMPTWMAGLRSNGLLTPPKYERNGKGVYKAELTLQSTTIRAPNFPVKGQNTLLDWGFKGNAEIPLDCTSPLKVYASTGASEFEIFGTEIDAKLTGGIKAEQNACVFDLPTGYFGFDLEAKRNVYRKSVLVMLTYFNAAVGASVDRVVVLLHVEQYVNKLGEIYVDGKFNFGAEADINFTGQRPYFQVANAEVEGGLGIEAGFKANVNVLELKIWAGADGRIKFVRRGTITWPPTSGWSFDSVTLTGEVGAKIRVSTFLKDFEQEMKGGIEWVYKSRNELDTLSEVGKSPFYLIPHPSPRNYARFQGQSMSQQAFAVRSAPLSTGTAQLTVSPLATNVYTYTEPTLALNLANDTGMLLWVHDDINKPLGQSHELKFSRWDGTNWSVPASVTDDNVIDEAPQVAWDAAGNAVAVWSRMSEPMPADATWDEQTAKKTEIGTATYNASTGTWSSPVTITSNDALDMTPRIAQNASGEVIATWRQNSAGLLNGDPTNPDRIVVAQMNQGVWGAPTVAVDNIPGLADLAIGNGTDTSTIAFTRYLTATGAPSATLQLFTSTQTNGSWSQPVQLTDDQLGHRNPRILYNGANQPLLIWLAGQELRLRNMVTGDVRSLTVPQDIGGIDEFRVVQDGSGNIAAVFTAQTGQRDLWVSFYNQASELWGLPTRLTDNRASESYPAAAMDTNGRLLMAYSSTAITSQDRTVTDPETGQTITYSIPVEGQTDLMTLSKTFDRNLTLTDQQFSISDEYPSAGAVVRLSATITNTGDLPLNNVNVQFFDGSPSAGGIAIGTATLPHQLAAGYTATLTIDYTVPGNGGAHEIYAVADPSATIGETNEADNVARREAFGPDLEIVSAEVEPWSGSTVGLRSVIRNTGTTTSPPSALSYLRDSAAGSVLVTEPVPSLAVGEIITLTTPFDYGTLGAGSYTLLASVNRSDFVETFKQNNTYTSTLAVQPDLLIPADDVVLTPQNGMLSTIAATVYNNGSIPATNATVGVYRRGTLDQPALLFSRALPEIPPGGAATIEGPIEGSFGCGVFVAANPDQTLPEMTYENNLASVVTEDGYCANFVYTPASGIENTTVEFTDTSSGNVTAWQWDFGDGTTSTERNPSHRYEKTGTYDVTLRIIGADGSDEFKRAGAVVIYRDPAKVDIFLPLIQAGS